MKDFFQQINLKNQQFKCYRSGDGSESIALTVGIHHELNIGATDGQIQLLKTLIPNNNNEIVEFYKLHNGINLYCNDRTSGIKFCPIADLEVLNENWKEWLSGYQEDELFDFQNHGYAFGEIPQSGNYFVFYNGRVFYSDHDDFEEIDLGNTFNEFLLKIVTRPIEFFNVIGFHIRYSDGKTDGQWIPEEFIADEE